MSRKEPQPECWLSVGMGIWRRFTTPEDATKHAKKNRPAITWHIVGDATAEVDGMGRILADGEQTTIKEVERFPAKNRSRLR